MYIFFYAQNLLTAHRAALSREHPQLEDNEEIRLLPSASAFKRLNNDHAPCPFHSKSPLQGDRDDHFHLEFAREPSIHNLRVSLPPIPESCCLCWWLLVFNARALQRKQFWEQDTSEHRHLGEPHMQKYVAFIGNHIFLYYSSSVCQAHAHTCLPLMSFQVLNSWAVTERRCKNREAWMACCLLRILYRYNAPLITSCHLSHSGNLWSEDKLHCYGIVIVGNCWRKCISSLPVPPRALTLDLLYLNF